MANAKWTLDPTHSEIVFKAKHLMITNVTGNFGSFEVNAETEGDDFTKSTLSFSANVASINTNNEQRDAHLKSADFFDADNYPSLNFVGTSFKQTGDDYELTGDLTIRGVTKNVKLNVEFGGINKDPWGNTKAGFTITGKINRKDFGLNWNAALETGGVLVSEEIRITCEIQLVKQAAA